MKIIVTGSAGQLGHDVVNELKRHGHEAIGIDIADLDITDSAAVKEYIDQAIPDAIIHCAAYTAVDDAEDNEEICSKINADGTRNIAKCCKRLDIPMIYISTDYVFSGQGNKLWKPDDKREPLNVYGKTKCDGERAVQELLDKYFIVRIAWVFGKNGKNFVKTMLNLAEKHDYINVVNDQFGSPTYTYDLSKLLCNMIETDKYGIYHATNEGICTWYEFACEIFRQAGLKTQVIPVRSNQFPAKAKRPQNSRMAKEKLEKNGFSRLPSWQDALSRFLKELEVI